MQTSSVDAKVRLFLSCARVWGDKLCKAIEKSINLFNCFSEPQPILCKSDDLAGVFNSCCVLERAKCAPYLFPLALMWVLQSIWQFLMSVAQPLLHAATWSASISASFHTRAALASWPRAQSRQLDAPFASASFVWRA